MKKVFRNKGGSDTSLCLDHVVLQKYLRLIKMLTSLGWVAQLIQSVSWYTKGFELDSGPITYLEVLGSIPCWGMIDVSLSQNL